jgi:release factor glutamine methyltransferase
VRSVKEALDFGAKRLKEACDRPRFEAAILLGRASGLSRAELALKEEALIDDAPFEAMIARRERGEPIEYITGFAGFYSREFLCESGVLIPRPETEFLVDRALALAKDFAAPIFAEIGVGSGAVALTLLALEPNARVIATDISVEAIALAAKNAERFGVADRLELICANLLEGVNSRFDILLSNPPYIRADYPLPRPVLFEPKTALIGGERGTEILEAIIALKKPILACECGYDQEEILRAKLDENGYRSVAFYKDYAGLTRGFTATL